MRQKLVGVTREKVENLKADLSCVNVIPAGALYDADSVFVKHRKDGSISLIYEQQLRRMFSSVITVTKMRRVFPVSTRTHCAGLIEC